MNHIDTPYRHHEFLTPNIHPFNNAGPLLWSTLVGTFLRPIIESTDMTFWFCNHGEDFQFCFAHEDYKQIEEVIEDQKNIFQATSKVCPIEGVTIGTAFCGMRWMAKAKMDNITLTARRSQLILQFLHSTSTLYLDCLVQQGAHWRGETNDDLENPLGNGFESLMHLVSNISQARFELRDGNRTDWMPPQPDGNTSLWL